LSYTVDHTSNILSAECLFGLDLFVTFSLTGCPIAAPACTTFPSLAGINKNIVFVILARKLPVKAAHAVLRRITLQDSAHRTS
jgi:hypothetical protein